MNLGVGNDGLCCVKGCASPVCDCGAEMGYPAHEYCCWHVSINDDRTGLRVAG